MQYKMLAPLGEQTGSESVRLFDFSRGIGANQASHRRSTALLGHGPSLKTVRGVRPFLEKLQIYGEAHRQQRQVDRLQGVCFLSP